MENKNTLRSEEAVTIANTIAQQIGRSALFMIGAKNLTTINTDCGGLSFKIDRNAKSVNYVQVHLTPADLYRVEFRRVSNTKAGIKNVLVSEQDGVYAEDLHGVLESGTGMYTHL